MIVDNLIETLIQKGYKKPTTVLELIENSDLLILTVQESIEESSTREKGQLSE